MSCGAPFLRSTGIKMPQITKTRQIADRCFVYVHMTCPPELRNWDRHLFHFFEQASGLFYSTKDPALHFDDGSLKYPNLVRKKLDGHICLFEFFLIQSCSTKTTLESLRSGLGTEIMIYPKP